MINVNMTEFNKTMKEALEYSRGFLAGVESNEILFNQQLAEVIKEAFYKYLDSTARLDPDRLHHMYEWGQSGVDKARLFRIEAFSGKQSIRFVTEFMQSEEVTITNPGGNVAGQFAATAREFFTNYLDQALLRELMKELQNPVEFAKGWGKGMNYGKGMKQGQRYLTIKGGVA